MFKYNQDRDRFIPDRLRNSYFFNSVQHNPLNHLCIGVSNCRESDFIEPFECERQQEQQTRALRQLQSYMSLELNGGHLLGLSINAHQDKKHAHNIDSYLNEDEDLKWPIRMADRRLLARKSVTKTLNADLLLDMPNLSNNWMTKILDWSSTGYLTAAIESSIHLWSDRTQSVHYTIRATDLNESESSIKTTISSLKWDVRGEKLGYSFTVDRIYHCCPLDETIIDTDSHTNTSEGSNGSTLHGTPTASRVSTHTIFDGDRLQNNTLEGAHTNTPEQPSFNTSEGTTVSLNGVVKTHYIKVWRLNGEQDGSNNEQKSSTCSCLNNNNNYHRNECTVVVMDWLANGSILVTGCTRGTVTFFKYDIQQKQLITTHKMHFGKLKKTSIPTLISCLHVSLDKWSRHLAVASYSPRVCVLRVFKIIDPPGLCHISRSKYDGVDLMNMTESLTDRYRSNDNIAKWVIKAFAWHPWKYSLMCYAVMSVNQDVPSFGSTAPPSWFVLANACKGQVLKRVEQTMCRYTCPTVQILTINTHSMTFSHITGELLVSTTTAYIVQKSSTSSPSLIEKHSVMVMHTLNRIVETLNCTQTEKGLLFAWSPDGLRIALTSSDECLRIWNFWPTIAVKKKPDNLLRNSTTNGTPLDTLDILIDDGVLSSSTIRSNVNNYLNNQSLMSELSLDASRIIK